MIPILVLKTENKVIYNKSNLNCKTVFEEFSQRHTPSIQWLVKQFNHTVLVYPKHVHLTNMYVSYCYDVYILHIWFTHLFFILILVFISRPDNGQFLPQHAKTIHPIWMENYHGRKNTVWTTPQILSTLGNYHGYYLPLWYDIYF